MISLTSKTDRAMKKIMKFVAALAVILTASCNKEMNPSEGLVQEGKKVKVTLNATAEDAASKVLLNGTQFEWEEGDCIQLRWANDILGNYADNSGCEKVYAKGTGRETLFEGEIKYVEESIYAYYSNAGFFHSLSGIMYCHDVSSVQTGKKEDLKDNIAYYARIHKNNITFNKEDNQVTSINLDAAMSPTFALLKFYVPEELALTEIRISSTSNLYGRTYISPQRSWGTFGDGNSHFHRPPKGETTPQGNIITISRDGNLISGDVYAAIAIDGYDETAANYRCKAESLNFTFINAAGEFVYSKNLKESIYLGTIKDLGSIPSTVMPVGALGIIGGDKTNAKVGILAPNPGYKFYYEIGESSEKCPTPTSASAELDMEKGIAPSASQTYNSCYIKVFADTDLDNREDCYFEGYFRSWRFLKGCPAAVALTGWSQSSEPVMTSDGLYISNSKAGDIAYTQYDEFMKIKTPFVSINALPKYDSKCWMNFYVGSSEAGYNLNVGNATSGKSTYNGYNTKQAVTNNSNNCFTWYLGNVTAGLNLALRGDRQHNYYRMSILEVL